MKFNRMPITSPEEAVKNFITEWCYKCDIFDLLHGKTLEEIKPLCPASTLDTCPTYQKIKLYQSVQEGYHDSHSEQEDIPPQS